MRLFQRLFVKEWVVPGTPPVTVLPDIGPVNLKFDEASRTLTYDVPAPTGNYAAEARLFFLPATFDLTVTDEAIWNAGYPFTAFAPITGPATGLSIAIPAEQNPPLALVAIAAWV